MNEEQTSGQECPEMEEVLPDGNKPREECGIFAIHGHSNASEMTYLGLYALQHRGQESTGMVTTDGTSMFYHRDMGLVGDVFRDQALFRSLKGQSAIGHNRYSTTGSSTYANAQPILSADRDGPVAIAHNGNLTNAKELYDKLISRGAIFQTTLDSEIIIHLTAMSKKPSFQERFAEALQKVQGAYCFVLLTRDCVIAARDPRGFRPLCLGKVDNSYVVASETCALDIINATYIRDVEPGEVLIISDHGIQSRRPAKPQRKAQCIFEYIYFSRPDSYIFGHCVDTVRREIGRTLAREHPIEADVVIPVPDSSNSAALGYSHESGIPFDMGLIRNHYIGRTFINPSQVTREHSVRIKFNPVRGVLEGKRVIVVEDSIVRGTTFKKIAKLLRDAGIKKIHLRVSSPPIIAPCFYGMDFPTREELMAAHQSVDDIRRFIGVDTLGYLSLDGLLASVPDHGESYCHACFSSQYPTSLPGVVAKGCIEDSESSPSFIPAITLRYK